ncbi:unnamed protein product [Brassicogethes aeneus]|uniref:Saccharopine dehydrogenase NADP binding domain-containing protein n=1 Tax=Brassicogethes aeneus TaxID=1431903 RepID=A0A9P0B4G6_BRAAE|nr:unnamed protein product [Brassicogethes aeneus]
MDLLKKHFFLPLRRNYEPYEMASRLDLLILGATGFTGKHCIGPILKMSKANGRNLSWGVAGRSEDKLDKVLKEMGEKLGENLDSIPKVIVDINSEEDLKVMAQKAKVVVNCCGPYRFLGEAVVKACVEAGTHHVDVSGEPQYMEKMQLKYHQVAQEKGVYVVSACGFDSIPCDMGVVFMQQNFEGTLNSVKTYLTAWTEGDVTGPLVNYGTWHSLVYGLAHADELKGLRRQLYPTRTPKLKPEVKTNMLPHRVDGVKGWVLPFLGSDKSVARRSQRYFLDKQEKRPVQVDTYFTVPSVFAVFLLSIFGLIFTIFTKFNLGIQLLLKYPEFFSGGYFSKESPSEKLTESTKFKMTFHGEGWREKLRNVMDSSKTTDEKIVATVEGTNPGYGATCVSLVTCAIMILTEKNKLPAGGGVYSPGACFAKTSMIKELNENGLKFEMVSKKEIDNK